MTESRVAPEAVSMALALVPPAAYAPLGTGLIRESAEAFQVDEILDVEPDGSGEHLWLRVQKWRLNTLDVVRHLCRQLRIDEGAVGYCGLKDREALTTQWLSVPATTDVERCLEQLQTRIDGQPEGGFRVLELARHAQKLKRG
ncbi:MAG: tRNA pseudouridine(13) synthase TruD, partial [Gammaproteobacteria bacterium]|nr:tRNA pseudouridine(13) synthase TruD [Gammaproteobacteria bacterium]